MGKKLKKQSYFIPILCNIQDQSVLYNYYLKRISCVFQKSLSSNTCDSASDAVRLGVRRPSINYLIKFTRFFIFMTPIKKTLPIAI